MEKVVKILLIENEKNTVVNDLLKNCKRTKFEITTTNRISEGMECFSNFTFDIIMLDLMLPNGEGLQAFLKVHNKCPNIPIIVLSKDEEIALEIVKNGAQDYLIKDTNLMKPLVVRSIHYAIERKKIENIIIGEKKVSVKARNKLKLLQSKFEFEMINKIDEWKEETIIRRVKVSSQICEINTVIGNMRTRILN